MSSDIDNPVVRFYRADSSEYWDASSITTRVLHEFGRNRPFAYAEVDVKKAYFRSVDLYWGQVSSCPSSKSGKILPEIILGQTEIHIEAYGESYDMIVDDSVDTDDYITFKCYSKAYKLRSAIYLSSLCEISGTVSSGKITPRFISRPAVSLGTISIGSDDRFTISTQNVIIHYRVGVGNTLETEFIEGTPSNIFKFIVTNATTFKESQCIVDAGYSYDYKTEDDNDVVNSYEEATIRSIKSSPVIAGNDPTVRLRVNYLCWDIIKSLGYLTNRWAFFYDYAYFVDYNESSYANRFKTLKIDYGADEDGVSNSYTVAQNSSVANPLDIIQIADSKDQGTTYVQSIQKVSSENHSEIVSITDVQRATSGKDITFPYPETYNSDVFSNSTRDRLTRLLAFERIVTNYHPLDCVQFSTSEVQASLQSMTVKYVVSSDSERDELKPTNGEICAVTDGVMPQYYIYDSSKGGWASYDRATFSNVMDTRFGVYCIIDQLDDVQNDIHMLNAPLAFTQRIWPSCITTFAFGNPEFIDSAYQLSGLETTAENSVTNGLADFDISDSQAAKIVVGNQTLSQLYDNREGFTGLIMEKNRDKELYRLAGYDEGVLQAFFDSRGRIFSGNAVVDENGDYISGVMIDHDGIAILGNGKSDEGQGYSYVPYEIDSNGNINFTNGNLYTSRYYTSGRTCLLLGPGGLITYNSNGDATSGIDAETGRIYGTTAVFANTTGKGYVVIDDAGLRTYSTAGNVSDSGGDASDSEDYGDGGLSVTHTDSTLQCSVGTNGAITAGQGRVVLDRLGLRTFSTDYNSAYGSTAKTLSDKELMAVNQDNLQCYIGTDGKIVAGKVGIGNSGISIKAGISSDGTLGSPASASLNFTSVTGASNVSVDLSSTAIGLYPSFNVASNGSTAAALLIYGFSGISVGSPSTFGSMATFNSAVDCESTLVCPKTTNGVVYAGGSKEGWYVIYSYTASYSSYTSSGCTYFMFCGGYDSDSSVGATPVDFPKSFSTVFGATVTTDRGSESGEHDGQSERGSNYVRNLNNSGMTAIHDQNGGFYWMAWGLTTYSSSSSGGGVLS